MVATGFVAVTTGTGSMQIYAFDLDGRNERVLTRGSADHHYPSLSPDGRQLLFTEEDVGGSQIYSLDMGAPATQPASITRRPMVANSASWSPNGTSIVYSALVPGLPGYQIFRSKPDGSDPIQLTHTANSGNASPVFSPDGTMIAFINGATDSQSGPRSSPIGSLVDRIWVMNADGSAASPLTSGPRDAYPAWLDSRTVLFARSLGPARGSQVMSVGLTGGETVLSPSDQFLVEPKPLPDGRSYGATQRTTSSLRVVTVARKDHEPLTAPGPPDETGFVIKPISVPPHDGSVFTIAWVLAPARLEPAAAPTWWLIAVVAFGALLAVAGVLASRRIGRRRPR
jgi:Tol biopolymer transport system component